MSEPHQRDTNYAELFQRCVDYAMTAHLTRTKPGKDGLRFLDGQTPFSTHLLWSASMLLQESVLPSEIRHSGALALLFHDLLEDTDAPLPDYLPAEVVDLVKAMTFDCSSEKEWERLSLEAADSVLLCKLYEKTNTLLDACWMSRRQLRSWCLGILNLADRVEGHYGTLNIVIVAKNLGRHGLARSRSRKEENR